MTLAAARKPIVFLLVALALLPLNAIAAHAEAQSGNLYGRVVDDQGAQLANVKITVSGSGAPLVQVTNGDGQFRFLGLSPGTYTLDAERAGFSSARYPNIVISVSRNTTLDVQLSPAVEETAPGAPTAGDAAVPVETTPAAAAAPAPPTSLACDAGSVPTQVIRRSGKTVWRCRKPPAALTCKAGKVPTQVTRPSGKTVWRCR